MAARSYRSIFFVWSHALAPGSSALVSCAAAVQASGQALADTVADMVDGTDRDRGLPLRNDVLGLVRGGTASLVGLGELDMSAKAWPFVPQSTLPRRRVPTHARIRP